MATKTRRTKSAVQKQTEKIEMNKVKANESLAMALVENIAKNPRIEFFIVSNYCEREGKVLADEAETNRKFFALHPELKK